MNWTEFLTSEAETTYATAIHLIDKVVPERLGWKPGTGSNWMTVGQLLRHISNGCGAGCNGLVTGDWGLPAGQSIDDIPPEEMIPPAEKLPTVKSVDEAKALLLEDKELTYRMIREAGEDALAHREFAMPWEPDKGYVLGRQLYKMIQHLDRHKSQLFYYLKLQDIPLNTTDLWG